MKKSHRFDELSDKVCNVVGCNKNLKERVAGDGAPWTGKKEAHNIKKCYRCYSVLRGIMRHDEIPGHKTDIATIKQMEFEQKRKKVAKANA